MTSDLGLRASILFAIGATTVLGFAFVGPYLPEFRRLPKLVASPKPSSEVPFCILARPQLIPRRLDRSLMNEILTIPILVFLLWFLYGEYKTGGERSGRYALYFTYLYLGWSLVTHVAVAVRLGRDWIAESHLVRQAEMTMGRIIGQSRGRITYIFRDALNNMRRGTGADKTGVLFEDMQVAVLYDPESPAWNLPFTRLNFHVVAANQPQTATLYAKVSRL